MANGMTLVLDPVAPLAAAEARLTERPRSLAGKRVALLSTEGRNAREFMEEVARLLREREGIGAVRHRSRHGGGEYDQDGATRTARSAEALPSLAPSVDIAISGVGL